MGDARHDLGLNVGLDGLPFLTFLRSFGRQDLAQVARFDFGDHIALSDGVKVFDDWLPYQSMVRTGTILIERELTLVDRGDRCFFECL